MNPFRLILLLVAAFAGVIRAEFTVRSWDTENGLPQNSVFSIAQTPDGYLWLGTGKGLARFNGLQFTVFNQANTPALNDNRIRTLFVDRRGMLWIGTDSGAILTYFNGRFAPAPDIPVGPSERRLVSACDDSDGSVWLLNANKELWRYDGQHCALFYLGERDSNEGRSVIKLIDGRVIVATDRRESVIASGPAGLSDVRFVDEILAKTDTLVASRLGGYWRLADFRIRWGTNRQDEVDFGSYRWPRPATAACEDRNGDLVVGTGGAGLYWIGRNGTTNGLSAASGLSYDYVLSVFSDREGILWVGTDGGGLNRVTPKVFNVVSETRGWVVQSVAMDSSERVWIGARSYGVAYWKTNNFRWFSAFEGAPPFVTAIYCDQQERVWAGTPDRGLFSTQSGRFEPSINANETSFQAIHQDSAGRLWFGTAGGLLRFDGKDWKLFSSEDGLSSGSVTAIAEDPTGDLWIGTQRGGLVRMHNGQFTAQSRGEGAPGDDVTGLLVDGDGVLWVSTDGNGLRRFANGRWSRFTTREGLVSNDLGYMLEDHGEFWIGSYAGVLRVSKRELNEVADGKLARVQCRAYGTEDGLPIAECSTGSQPGALRDKSGRLWFPTIKGLAYVDPSRLIPNTNAPPVTIEAVFIDNKETSLTNTISLTPANERFEVNYAALNLSAPERAIFRYRMEGHEANWNEAGNGRVARYSKLPPGKYSFQVIACNEDGVWNLNGARLALTVQPPYWKTWWFITAMTLLAIGAVAGSVYLASRQRYERQLAVLHQQEALEKERARIARDIHDQVGASLTQVALIGELVESDKDSPADVETHARQICQTARETTRALDEIVWTVNPQNDTLEGLVNYICKYGQDYLGVAGIRYRLDVPTQLPNASIAPDVRHNVFLASKEAITNVVRHSRGDSAWLRIRVSGETLIVEVEDNGRGLGGLDPKAASTRHGLSNMRKRMEDVGGTFALEPGREAGAIVRLTVPLHIETEKHKA